MEADVRRRAHAERREAMARAVAPGVVAAFAASPLEPGERLEERPQRIAVTVLEVTDAILAELDR